MYDIPLIFAVTLKTTKPCPPLLALPDVSVEKLLAWPTSLAAHTRGDRLAAVERSRRLCYSLVDRLLKLEEPEVPEGYFGPRYAFRGAREAVYAATFFY
jgi:hypothetical protein